MAFAMLSSHLIVDKSKFSKWKKYLKKSEKQFLNSQNQSEIASQTVSSSEPTTPKSDKNSNGIPKVDEKPECSIKVEVP